MDAQERSEGAELRLAGNEVHIWRVFLDSHDPLKQPERILTADERVRAARFVFPRDRHRFTIGRAILRDILGSYLRKPAAAIELVYEKEGKPSVGAGDGEGRIRFNLSHSHGLAVYAIASGREIGVDVESVRSDFAGDDIAARFFSSKELAELRRLSRADRQQGFFLCWTRKEAYVKAKGGGLSIPLDSFDVSLTPGAPATLGSVDGPRWMMKSFQPADGYVGAVVAEGQDWTFQCRDWASSRAWWL